MKKENLELLEKYGQTHLLQFYEKLDAGRRDALERQIEELDWGLFSCLENDNTPLGKGEIRPLGALSVDEIGQRREEYTRTGLEAIRAGKVGALMLAGGQGTRLGYAGPKGTFNIGVDRELYIFQQQIRNTLDVVEQAGAWVPFFVMTSERNHEETVEFLKGHNYFGYNPDYMFFFKQSMAPSLDFDRKLLMEKEDRLVFSPNGNGGWFTSFVKAGMHVKAKEMGVEWLNAFAVDNVLQRIADPCFLGAVLAHGCVSGAKVVRKAEPEERVGVLCLEDGKPSIIEYYEMTKEMSYAKDDKGEYLYNFGVILNYLFRLDKLEQIAKQQMPVHVVEKKIPYVDPDGMSHMPAEPNGYKFETLILDMVHMMDDCLSYEVVREHEFAPVKNKEGVDSIDTARELLRKNGIQL